MVDTLHEEVKALIASATSSVLPGGVFDANDIEYVEGSAYEWAKGEGLFTGGVVLVPFASIRWHESNAYQAEHPKLAAEREFFEAFIHQNLGYGVIDQAVPLIKVALHDQYVQSTDRELAHITYAFRSAELKTEEFGFKPMKFVRFSIVWR